MVSDFLVPFCTSGAISLILAVPLLIAGYFAVSAIVGAVVWVSVFLWRIIECDRRARFTDEFYGPPAPLQVEPG